MADVRVLLDRFGLYPRKDLGQHFLTNAGALAQIVDAAELTSDDTVLEVGAGLGTLTHALAGQAGRVLAVEIDRRLIPILQEELAEHANVTIVQGDILTLDPADLVGSGPYKVVANLPYGITSALLRHLLEARVPPTRMVLTVQREVAERIVARDGRMSLLAVSVCFYGQPRLLFRLKRGSFFPQPGVESAVICIDRHLRPPVEVRDVADFFRVVRAGFSQPRKQLRNSLAAGLGIEPTIVAATMRAAGLDPHQRAERLQLEDWAAVMNALG